MIFVHSATLEKHGPAKTGAKCESAGNAPVFGEKIHGANRHR